MYGYFDDLQKYLKFDTIKIDNNVFRLHYKITVMVFVCCGILISSGQYIGDPIDCIADGVPGGLMDTYCWIHSTFSIPSRWTGKQGVDVPHPGISPVADLEDGTDIKYHRWYQWAGFFFYLQVLFFYLPRHLWKTSENGKVSMLIGDLKEPLLSQAKKEEGIDTIVKYFRTHRGTHGLYAFRFFLLEIWNFINVIAQLYFIDFFLDYEFTSYGADVLSYTGMEYEDRPDPMAKVFPKVTKCTFHLYGPSGSVQLKDGLCVLPLNIINEKIFIMIWFWMIFVASVTGIFLIYRLATLVAIQLRVFLITQSGGKSVKRSDVESILEPASLSYFQKIGDWFLLKLICVNLHPLLVNDLIRQLHKADVGDNSNTETLKARDHTPV